MGGCATKLRVLMADGGETPAPLPKEEAAVDSIPDGKEAVVVEELKKVDRDFVVDAGTETVDDEKRQSLGTLFKEIEGKNSTAPSELIKPEETPIAEAPVDKSEKKPLESNEAGKAVEVAPATGIPDQKATESLKATETTLEPEKKNIAVEKAVTETKATEASKDKKVVELTSTTVIPKSETPKEEKAAEKLATSSQKPATPEEKKAVEKEAAKEPDVKKVVEEKLAAVTPKPETPKEEKKVEKPATLTKDGK